MRATLKRQSTNAFLIASLVPLAIVCVLLATWFVSAARDDLADGLERGTANMAARLDLYLAQHARAIESAAETLSASGATPARSQRWVDTLRARYPGFLTVIVADPAGTIVAGAPADEFAAIDVADRNVADREYFRMANLEPDAFVSGTFRGRGFGDDPIVAISQGLAWDDGRRGVLEGSLDLGQVTAMVRANRAIGETMLIVDDSGTIVASSNPAFVPLEHRISGLLGSDVHGRYLVREARSEATGWQVLLLVERSSVYGPLLVFAAAMLAALLASLLLAGVLFNRLQGPVIDWFAAVSRRLSRSELDAVEIPAPPRQAPGELHAMGRSLEELIETVRGQRDQLRRHLASLEERVRERTTELESANRELRNNRRLLEQFVRQAPVAIALFDRQMRFLGVSDRWLEEFDLRERSILGRTFGEVLPALPERWHDRHAQCIAGRAQRVEEEPMPRADGSIQWVRWAMDPWEDADGDVAGTVMMAEFVTEKKRLRDKLRHLADHDSLTGLLNRRAFIDLVERTLRRGDAPTHALLFIDLDDFKLVNDRLGHATGDEVLRQIGDRLRSQARAGDVAGRLGGDEFVVLARIEDPREVAQAVERYRAVLDDDVATDTGRARVTVSIGSTVLHPRQSAESVLHAADEAMYADKRERDRTGPD